MLFAKPGESKKFRRLASCGIKSMWPIIKIEMWIYKSKAKFNVKISFGKITHLIDMNLLTVQYENLFWSCNLSMEVCL